MGISTAEFKNKIVQARSICDFVRSYEDAFVDETFTGYINELLKMKKIKKNQLSVNSQISKTYLYELFSGKRAAPSRDICIQLVFGLTLSHEEADKLLRLSGHSLLYAKNKRDAIIIFCLHNKNDLIKTNIKLEKNNLPCLGDL